jgi:hypothetical protein
MATPFFPLTPQGLGTEDVEALDSYILRLATEHGVTEYQFHRLLASWWNSVRSEMQCELGRHVGYVSKVGYGKDIDTLVQALEIGTGQEGFSGLTLSAFREICGTHVGCQSRHVHYWCPACMKDQVQENSPVYEKLAWRLKAISRCRAHKLALESMCPWCGRHQLRHVNTWPNCSECGQSLIAKEGLWRPSFFPSDGESDMLEVIAYCAAHPGTVFQRDAASQFWELVRDDRSVGDRPRTQYFHRKVPDRTLISVLLRFAREVKVPLLSILLDPVQAATIRPLPIEESISVSAGKVPHRVSRLSIAQRKALGRALQSYLRSSKTYQSLEQLCRPFPCTTGAARYWYPELVRAVVEHNRELWRCASDSQDRALEGLRIDLLLISRAEEVGWHKVEGDLAKQCDVPLHRVRKRISDLKKATAHLDEENFCEANHPRERQ